MEHLFLRLRSLVRVLCLKNEGYEAIIAIPLTSGISGFYNSLVTLAHNHPEFNLYPYDPAMTVRSMGNLVLAAAKMIKNGWEPKEILSKLDEIRDTIDVLLLVPCFKLSHF